MNLPWVCKWILAILLSLGSVTSQKLLYWPDCHGQTVSLLDPETIGARDLALGAADARYKNINVSKLNEAAERDISIVKGLLRRCEVVELREYLGALSVGEIILLPEFCQNLYLLWDRNVETEVFYLAHLPAFDYMVAFEDIYKLSVSIFTKASLASKTEGKISLISGEFCVLAFEPIEDKIWCSDFLFEDLESVFDLRVRQSILPERDGISGVLELGDGREWRVLEIGESGRVMVKLWGTNSCLEMEDSVVLRKRVVLRECVEGEEGQGYWMASELDF